MAEQICVGHIVVLPLPAVATLPNLAISPASHILQLGCCLRPIYNYTAGSVNGNVRFLAPPEAMQFGTASKRL
eukprot:14589459-Ditylum_brightwellii.AAC.2